MDHHDVERVTVIGLCRWHEPPVVGVRQSGQQGFAQSEGSKLKIVGELRAAAAGRLDDHMRVAVFSEGGHVEEIWHGGIVRLSLETMNGRHAPRRQRVRPAVETALTPPARGG